MLSNTSPLILIGVTFLNVLAVPFAYGDEPQRPRARDLHVAPGVVPPGEHNAITDVPGVRVGHATLIEGDRIRTGVTAILPHDGNLFQEKVPGAVFVGNAFGKLAGSTQVEELGAIETPIILTNTLAVGTAVDAVVGYTLEQPGNEQVRSVNSLVGETNDGGLNDIRGRHVTREQVIAAIQAATSGPVAEGCVGAGTGCEAFGWKGGIGTSSRLLPQQFGGWNLGVLVQANYGGVLTIDGAPVGKELGRHAFAGNAHADARSRFTPIDRVDLADLVPGGSADGSCMIVVATDAPLDARELKRLAARAIYALARTGSSYSNGSGDFAIAFSTAKECRVAHGATAVQTRPIVPTDAMSPLFQAVLEATEEAVYNALLQATTITANGRTVEAVPIDKLREILTRRVPRP
jgi:D-aminopeptidase